MNIFHKVALQGMKKNRIRTLVTIVGVVLSAAMITSVATFGTSLLNFMTKGSIEKYGDWHVEFLDANSDFINKRAADEEVSKTAAFENIGYAILEGAKSQEKPYLFIAGFNDEAVDTLPVDLISGRMPENSSEIIVPSHIAIKAGVNISVGDVLNLSVGSRNTDGRTLNQNDPYRYDDETLLNISERTYTVVGICDRPRFEVHSAPGYTLITKEDKTVQAESYSLFVTLKNPREVRAYASSIVNDGGYVLNDDVLRFMGISDNKLFNTVLYSAGSILVAIIMIGSIFLIYNSFNISLNERIHQFGILMSVGATEKQLRNSVIFEGFCIGIIGIPIGIIAGITSIKILLPVVAGNFSTIINSTVPLTISLSVPVLIAAAAVSLATILISAYIPARKAADIPIMDCIRQTNEIKIELNDVHTSKYSLRIYGLEGMLALKNFKRNKKRYRSVVLSLTLSVVLFVSGNAFGTTLKRLAKEYTVEMDGDISLYTQNIDENELFNLYDSLKTADGVYKSTYQADLTYSSSTDDFPEDFLNIYRKATGSTSTGKTLELPLDVQFIEDDIYFDFIKSLGLPATEYTGQNAKVLALAIDTKGHNTYFTNSTMDFTLLSKNGGSEKTIQATFADSYPIDTLPKQTMPDYLFMAVVPWHMKPQFDTMGVPAQYGMTFWSENPALSMSQIQSMIDNTKLDSNYTLINLSNVVDLFRSATFVVDVFTYFFVIMISLIAMANVFNTISTNIRLRRREFAMLRSMGMSERGFNRMMNFECAIYGIRTLLFGIPIAGFISWLIYKAAVFGEKIDDLAFVFPWQSTIISVIGVFGTVFITMIYASNKIKKENIIDALRDDMT